MKKQELLDAISASNLYVDQKEALYQCVELAFTLQGLLCNEEQGSPSCPFILDTVDRVFSELVAACIFLSERSFTRVPEMLRQVQKAIDDSEEAQTSVPLNVKNGFSDLANRIEHTSMRLQQGKTGVTK